ncbi:LuxR family transcriptional regulator [Streptomyces sp. NPDC006879]|uniref:LuxR family transcriptional regulator n=1 Tax=Streptomyces sp. NPDC006879 TaxID=3364767 RepID=UPI00368EB759
MPTAGPADTLRGAAIALEELSRTLATKAELIASNEQQPSASKPGTGTSSGFEYIQGLPEIAAAIQCSLDDATSEILTAQPDGPRPGVVLDKALAAVQERIAAGVSMRTLYQHSTRFDEPTKEYVRTVTGYGAQIRTLAEFFDRLIIVDRKIAFIPANADRTTAVIVSEPAMVKFLVDIFERAWDRAEPYPFLPVRAADAAAEIIPAIRDAICKLLIEGRSDREIARRLGFSLRSLQSHVARLKDEYGAQHRLQLGYLMGIKEATEGSLTPDLSATTHQELREEAEEDFPVAPKDLAGAGHSS